MFFFLTNLVILSEAGTNLEGGGGGGRGMGGGEVAVEAGDTVLRLSLHHLFLNLSKNCQCLYVLFVMTVFEPL